MIKIAGAHIDLKHLQRIEMNQVIGSAMNLHKEKKGLVATG